MNFSLGFFQALVQGAIALAAVGALLLVSLFVYDSIQRKVW